MEIDIPAEQPDQSLAKHPDSQLFNLLTATYPKQSANILNVQAQAGGPENY